MDGYYSIHSLARKSAEGRPAGGVSLFYKPWLGPVETIHTDENLLIAKTNTVTIIGTYIPPNTEVEDIMETLINSLQKIKFNENVILAGDMNCRLDKPDSKCKTILAFLEEENFKLVNDPEQKTYFAHNGSSTIDLIFHKGAIKVQKQEGVFTSSTTPLRKHIPILTNILIQSQKKHKIENRKPTIARKLNISEINKEKGRVTEAEKAIEQNDLNLALTLINKVINSGVIHQQNNRKAQPWFDKECYAKRKTTLNALRKAKFSRQKEDLRLYGEERRAYKNLLKRKKSGIHGEGG
ncbi:hypothetical protein C0J52_02335 [Blattella germanica]|nr:hypothetical protein C0J52_02335 [Blattella germanica]